MVEGQCDLSALAFSFVRPGTGRVETGRRIWQPGHQGAAVDLSGEGAAVEISVRVAITAATRRRERSRTAPYFH